MFLAFIGNGEELFVVVVGVVAATVVVGVVAAAVVVGVVAAADTFGW